MIQKREIVGISKHIQKVRQSIKNFAKEDMTVLILGPTGSGKELVANNIHCSSKRKEKSFIVVNCAAIPDQLFESELFGYEKGAFTGAIAKRIGKFELADKGTILLDEIGDMKPYHQSEILRVLQEKKIWRVGGTKEIKIDVRIIASTNKDLLGEIGEGRFREDLYHRLRQAVIEIEPLDERLEDIIVLTNYFIDKEKIRGKVDPRVKFLLYAYIWPGNVRELENMVGHINDFPYVKRQLEKEWKSISKKYFETIEKELQELLETEELYEKEDQDRFMETIEFVEKPDVDFKKYIEIYEIMMLNRYISKNEISKVLHLRKEKVFNFKKHYHFELDLENDQYWVHHPLDVYPQPRTLRNTFPFINSLSS